VWLRLAAASGFAVTLLYVVLSIFPIIDVASWLSFAAKISAVVIGLNLAGAALFLVARHRRTAATAAVLLLCGSVSGRVRISRGATRLSVPRRSIQRKWHSSSRWGGKALR